MLEISRNGKKKNRKEELQIVERAGDKSLCALCHDGDSELRVSAIKKMRLVRQDKSIIFERVLEKEEREGTKWGGERVKELRFRDAHF